MAPKSVKEKEQEKAARVKDCAHCGERFALSSAFHFIVLFKGTSVFCDYCQKDSVLRHPVNPAGFYMACIAAFLVAASVFIIINGAFWIAGWISPLFGLIGGMVLATSVGAIVLRIYIWTRGMPAKTDWIAGQ